MKESFDKFSKTKEGYLNYPEFHSLINEMQIIGNKEISEDILDEGGFNKLNTDPIYVGFMSYDKFCEIAKELQTLNDCQKNGKDFMDFDFTGAIDFDEKDLNPE